MDEVPQQDWLKYRALVGDSERQHARSFSLAERFALYEDMFRLVRERRSLPGNWGRLEKIRWEQKLAMRRRLNHAFAARDRQKRG